MLGRCGLVLGLVLLTALAAGCSAVDFVSMAMAHEKAGRYGEAISAAKQATEADPNYAPGWYWLGVSYFDAKQYPDAIEALRKCLALNPSPAQLASSYHYLGSAYNALKKYDPAIPLLKRAVELAPNNRVSYNNLGVAYGETGRYDLAIANLQRAIELDPLDRGGISNNNLGVNYYKKGQYALAVQAFERARDLGHPDATRNLEIARRAVAQPPTRERVEGGTIGIEFTIKDEFPTVVRVLDGSPAQHAGLVAGDRIVQIDGQSTKGLAPADIPKHVRGVSGTRVTLSVAREGWTSPRDFEIVRGPAPGQPPVALAPAPSAVPSAAASGFLLRTTNFILTNYHVVADGMHFTVTFPSGEQYPGRVAYRDPSNDLALIEIQGRPAGGGLVLAVGEKIQVGETVHAVGYPLGPGLSRQPSLVSGEISSTLGMGDDIARFRTTAPINPGNSGGPIVNQRGQVIGIAAAGLVRQGVEAIRFGIKASTAVLILQQAQVPTAFDVVVSPAAPATKSASEIFADVSPYVVLIETQ